MKGSHPQGATTIGPLTKNKGAPKASINLEQARLAVSAIRAANRGAAAVQ